MTRRGELPPRQPGQMAPWLARLTDDPVRLRRRAWLATVLVAVVGGLAYGFGDGALATLILACTWVAMPFLALGVALGDAFFVRHGRGRRRLSLTALAGVVLSLGSCGVLGNVTDASQSTASSSVAGAVYVVFFSAVVVAVGAALALALGRGEGYLSRKIQAVDDDGW